MSDRKNVSAEIGWEACVPVLPLTGMALPWARNDISLPNLFYLCNWNLNNRITIMDFLKFDLGLPLGKTQ